MFEVYMVATLGDRPCYRFLGEYERRDMAEKVAHACARCKNGETFRVVDYFGEVVENFICNDGIVTMH